MIKVFVSSTFRDMQAERDVLNTEVAGKLNSKAAEYGDSFEFVDLRWGVDTEGMSSMDSMKEILSICTRCIDDCKPYFLLLIGDVYGTMLTDEEMHTRQVECENVLDKNISVTELEIYHALFNKNVDPDHFLIYFREPLPQDMKDEYRGKYIKNTREIAYGKY